MDDTEREGMDRRQFLRRAAVTTVAAAWAAPIVQTVAATPAYAQQVGTPEPRQCIHSVNGDPDCADADGCMETCTAKCGEGSGQFCDGLSDADEPNGLCQDCNVQPCNQCPSVLYCDPDCINCDPNGATFIC